MSSLLLYFFLFSALAGAIISCVTFALCFYLVRRKVMGDWSPQLTPMIQKKSVNLLEKIKSMFPFAAAFLVGKTGDTLLNFAEHEMVAMIPEVQVEVLAQLKCEKKWIFLVAIAGAVLGIVTMLPVYFLS